MSYYYPPRPRPPYMGAFNGGYDGYGYYAYGAGSYGVPRGPRPFGPGGMSRGAFGRGRGRGGYNSGAAGNPTAKSADTSTGKVENAASKAEVKTEPGAEVKQGPGVEVKVESGDTATASSTAVTSTATAGTTATTAAATAATATTKATPKTPEAPLTEENPLPAEIHEKFFPNRCELCSVVFPIPRDDFIPEKGSLQYIDRNLQAKMHYSGKSHKKKLRVAFHKYTITNRIPQNKVPKKARELMRDNPVLPKEDSKEDEKMDLHCKVCDLSFTSIQHASQHYGGRNHQRKVEGKPPLKTGYFNPHTGRWQRTPVNEAVGPNSGYYGRFYGNARGGGVVGGVGVVKQLPRARPDPNVVTVEVVPENLAGVKQATHHSGAPSKFYCAICNVSATNQAGLDTHLNGSKHKLAAMKTGSRTTTALAKTTAATDSNGSGAGEMGPPPAKRAARDYSHFKTPTGKYYCLPCNSTMNSETQFAQHFESKKHKMEAAKQRGGVAAKQ